jgi:SAM-dependent methyltransferase
MAHDAQRAWCARMRERFPAHFHNCRVLDFGSRDVNGSNRWLFTECEYTGIDLGPGRNVDVICYAHQFRCAAPIDTIISTEMLEHDRYWRASLANAGRLLRAGGLLVLTCAGEGRAEHGTRAHAPGDSPYTPCYYHNLARDELAAALTADVWRLVEIEHDAERGDLRTVAVRR